jgi:hypothetical protein
MKLYWQASPARCQLLIRVSAYMAIIHAQIPNSLGSAHASMTIIHAHQIDTALLYNFIF